MKKKGPILVLVVVLFPAIFFFSMAMSTNSVGIDAGQLKIEGAGGIDLDLDKISKIELIDEMPEVTNAGNFSLGLIKKGNFQRKNDGEVVRVIRNDDGPWIHIFSDRQEVYFNLSNDEQTQSLFAFLEEALEKESADF